MIVMNDLKRLLVAGGLVLVGLAILVAALKLAFILLGLLVPVIFAIGAVYLGYVLWQRHGHRVTGRRRSRW